METGRVIQFPQDQPLLDLPPQNIDAEIAVLGGILTDPDALSRVESILRPEMFYVRAHGLIYKACVALAVAAQPTDLMFVTEYLRNNKLLETVGGMTAIANIHASTISAINVDAMAQLVRDKWLRRELIRGGNQIIKLGYEAQTDWTEVLAAAQKTMDTIACDCTSQFGASLAAEDFTTIYSQIEENTREEVLPTGLYDLDKMITGLRRGDLDIIAGRASMGKTQLGVFLAHQVAVVQHKPVIFFSAEMNRGKLLRRFMALESGIDSALLLNNNISLSDWEKLAVAMDPLSSAPLFVDEHSNPSVAHMRAEVLRIQSQFGEIGLIVLDYLQMLGSSDARVNRTQDLDIITRGCKDIAKEFNVPFLALAQINRGVEGRSNKRPMISDLRESGGIEQAADVIMLLYRDDYYNPDTPDRGLIEISVGKNRDGSTGTAKFLFEPSLSRFRNLAGFGGR
jgi:replicative DNA helicase